MLYDFAVAGAVYNPELVIVPTVPLPPRTPLTYQFTAVLFMPVTSAVNCSVYPARMQGAGGFTVTVAPCVPAIPAPLSGTTRAPPGELLLTVKFAL